MTKVKDRLHGKTGRPGRVPLIRKKYTALAEAARTVATPQIRNMATIGGNLCQDTRCWYYRYPHSLGGRLLCLRKGSGPCLAVTGDNRYHAIFGGRKCFAACPSDMAVALMLLDAELKQSALREAGPFRSGISLIPWAMPWQKMR